MFGHQSFCDVSYNWILRKENDGLGNLRGVGRGVEETDLVTTISPSGASGEVCPTKNVTWRDVSTRWVEGVMVRGAKSRTETMETVSGAWRVKTT